MAGGEIPLIVAYGLGVDSTAMLVELARRRAIPDLILFADTGGEKPETYGYLPVMQRFLKAHAMPPVQVVRYVPQRPRKGYYDTLEGECLLHGHLPSLAYGTKKCSLKWKMQAQRRFIRAWKPAVRAWGEGFPVATLIGYDAGPADARRHMHLENEQYTFAFPLREWGWDRERCKAEIARAGLPVPLKSACFFCPAAKQHEITWLTRTHPDLADRIIRLELGADAYHERRRREGKPANDGLWRHGTKIKPGRMSDWIDFVRWKDSRGEGKHLPSYSEEGLDEGGIEDGCFCNFDEGLLLIR